MKDPLDKNGRILRDGDRVRPCATIHDYYNPPTFRVHTTEGELDLWCDGVLVGRISDYRNGDTNYHSLEII